MSDNRVMSQDFSGSFFLTVTDINAVHEKRIYIFSHQVLLHRDIQVWVYRSQMAQSKVNIHIQLQDNLHKTVYK